MEEHTWEARLLHVNGNVAKKELRIGNWELLGDKGLVPWGTLLTIFPHKFISFTNMSNILRYLYETTHLIAKTTSYNRKCGCNWQNIVDKGLVWYRTDLSVCRRRRTCAPAQHSFIRSRSAFTIHTAWEDTHLSTITALSNQAQLSPYTARCLLLDTHLSTTTTLSYPARPLPYTLHGAGAYYLNDR